ncbi:site-specific integrase [Propionibacterium phage B22]|uniref:Integrase n=1 Tax=Propionibacterium phage B22 TaxID=1897532 RepID=A0A1D8ETK2_9CAUD|nr:site-specific integrase [Propionibacterium phage B22]AOT24381.1 tyrosine integrase [Propionibacterium phage B22]
MVALSRASYGDGTQPTRRSDGRWAASAYDGWQANGNRRRRWVYGRTQAECKRKLRDLKREIWSDTQQMNVNPRETVKSWTASWLDDYRSIARPTTFATDESMVRNWIVPAIGARRLSELTARDASKLQRVCRDGGLSATTSHYAGLLLRRILKAARANGYRIPDSVMLARIPGIGASNRSALSAIQAANLLSTANARDTWPEPPSLPDLPYGAISKLAPAEAQKREQLKMERLEWTAAQNTDPSRWAAALMQGLRSGEARGLTWDRVDLDKGTITIDRQLQRIKPDAALPPGYKVTRLEGSHCLVAPKSRSGIRRVPIVPWMGQALTRWRDIQGDSPFGLVWPLPTGAPPTRVHDLRAWRGLQRVAGVHKEDGNLYVLHEARHSTVSLLLAAGVPESVVIAIVGHASFAATEHYAHTDLEAARAALMKVQDRLGLELES